MHNHPSKTQCPNMQRINVIGTSGSGKSTLAKKLATKLGYPYIEMDALYWQPNWVESRNAEFFPAIQQALQPPCWVLDGNYTRTTSIKWQQVDTVIWVDYSFTRTLYQANKRAIGRILNQQELWAGTGNTESFKQTFMSRDSVLLWTLKTYHKNKRKYEAIMQAPEYQHIRFIRLQTPKAAQQFLDTLL